MVISKETWDALLHQFKTRQNSLLTLTSSEPVNAKIILYFQIAFTVNK